MAKVKYSFERGEKLLITKGKFKGCIAKFKYRIDDYGYFTPNSKVGVYHKNGEYEVTEINHYYLSKIAKNNLAT